MRVGISERMQAGVVNTTFGYPSSRANVVTTEFSDFATNCPEYNVTVSENDADVGMAAGMVEST